MTVYAGETSVERPAISNAEANIGFSENAGNIVVPSLLAASMKMRHRQRSGNRGVSPAIARHVALFHETDEAQSCGNVAVKEAMAATDARPIATHVDDARGFAASCIAEPTSPAAWRLIFRRRVKHARRAQSWQASSALASASEQSR